MENCLISESQRKAFEEAIQNAPGLGVQELFKRCSMFEELREQGCFSEEDPIYIGMLMLSARMYAIQGEFDRSLQALEMVYSFAQKTDNTSVMHKSKNNMALVKQSQGQHFEAIRIFEEILDMDLDTESRFFYMNNLGVAYSRVDADTKAIDIYYKALKMMEGTDKYKALADVLLNLGNMHRKCNEHSKSIDFFNRAMHLYIDIGDNERLAMIYNNLCAAYNELLDFERAEYFALLAMEYFDKYLAPTAMSNVYNNLAVIRTEQGRWDDAADYYQKSMALAKEHHDTHLEVICLNNLALLACKSNDYHKAISIGEQSLVIFAEYSNPKAEEIAYHYLKEAYERLGNYQKALEALDKANSLGVHSAENDLRLYMAQAENEYLNKRLADQVEMYRTQNEELLESNRIIIDKTHKLETNINLLSATNTLLNRIISVIAHDVRGPVGTITQALEMIAAKAFSPIEQEELINKLIQSSKQTSGLIEELLRVAYKYKSGLDDSPEVFELNKEIKNCIEYYRSLAMAKDISIEFSTEIDPLKVKMNKSRVSLIVRNLLGNAIKFSNPRSSIRVILSHGEDGFGISIKDNGVGMSEESIKKIMAGQKFSSAGTKDERGFGLGLVFVLESILHTQGKLMIQSKPHEGSVFSINWENSFISPILQS